jgi:proteasome accessory factor B
MKKKTPSTRDESQRSAKVNGKKAAGAKTPKGSQKKGGGQSEAQRTRRHRMQVIHCELAQRYDNPNPAAPPINCPILAEKLEVSRYTIERDIAYMQNMEKLPIDFDPSRNTFFYREKVTYMPMTQFTQSELAALCFARMRADAFQRTSFDDALNSALDKLLLSLGPEFAAEAKRMEELISFRPSGFPAVMDFETFETIYEALRGQVELEMNYVSFHGENAGKKTERTVQPRHMTCHDNGWYLLTDDLRSGKERTFMLSRVVSVKATGKQFTPKKKLDLKKLKKSLGIFSTENEETVRLRCDAAIRQLIVERIWHESQEITELPDGGVELKLTVGVTQELIRLVCGFQGYAKVIEPDELGRQVERRGRRLSGG